MITARKRAIARRCLWRELDLGQKFRHRGLFTLFDAALKWISKDTSRECLNCEQEINAKRLKAIPWVRHCIACQELNDGAIEKTHAVVNLILPLPQSPFC
jgi:RNA polymerase-binding transcription factor DksA